MLRPDGLEEHRYTTGPWHWQQPGDADWREIDTDLEARADSTWKHGVRSARFDTVLADDGRRRFYPRRWVPGEYVTFGRLQYQRPAGSWANVPNGTMQRVGNRLVGAEQTTHRLEVGFHGRGSRTHLTLKTADLARPVRWSVSLVGLTWDNGALVSKSDGEQVGFIRPPSWTDSSENPQTHEVPWVYSGGYITLTPDFAGAVFPVDLDPDYSIATGNDDGYVTGTTLNGRGAFDYYLVIGINFGSTYHIWLRFAGISAAQGADCTAASIAFKCANMTMSNTIDSQIYAVDEDDHAAPTTYNEWNTDHGAHTTATVAWDTTAQWASGNTYTTSDFATVVDEILARAGWSTGNDLGIHIDENGGSNNYRFAASYENTSYTEPVLSLTVAAGGTPQSLVGSTAAAAAVQGSVKVGHRLGGSVAAAAAVQGDLEIVAAGVAQELVGNVAAATAVQGALVVGHRLAGSVQAAATVQGSAGIGHPLSGTVGAAVSVVGGLKSDHRLTGAIQAAAAVQGDLTGSHGLPGSVAAAATVTGDLTVGKPLAGTVTAAATVQGDIETTRQVTGTVTAAVTVQGSLAVAHPLTGAVQATASIQGDLDIAHAASGAIVIPDSAVQGDLTVGKQAYGTVASTVTVQGALAVVHQLGETIAAAATVQGNLYPWRALAGTVQSAASVTGNLAVVKQAYDTITAVTAVTGNLITWNTGRAGRVALSDQIVGYVTTADRLAGQATATATSANVTAAEAIAGTAEPSDALAGTVSLTESGGN